MPLAGARQDRLPGSACNRRWPEGFGLLAGEAGGSGSRISAFVELIAQGIWCSADCFSRSSADDAQPLRRAGPTMMDYGVPNSCARGSLSAVANPLEDTQQLNVPYRRIV